MGFRITTWNVNGIRNPFGYHPWRDKRTFDAMFDILEADIVVMQELKIQRKDLRDDMVLVPGWDCYFSLPRHKKGYSGVGIYTRQSTCAPIRAEEGILGVLCPPNSSTPYCDLPPDQHIGGYLSASQLADLEVDAAGLDAEGRCVVLEFPAFVIFGIYSPANSSGLRDDFRHGFQIALDTRIRNLIKEGKRVVVCGDLNVSREPIDTAKAEENMKKEGVTVEEYMSTPNRRIFNQLLEGGVVYGERDEGRERPVMWDACRAFHSKRQGMFTHWEQKINARPGNFGSRIDFVLCSLDMKSWFEGSDIQEGLMGSDHCPVYAVLKDKVHDGTDTRSLTDMMHPHGTFENGSRLREYSSKTIPAFSARLMPEFHQRRSIRDMFGKKPSLVPSSNSTGGTDGPGSFSAETDSTKPKSDEQSQSVSDESTSRMSQPAGTPATTTPVSSPERKRSAAFGTPGKQAKRSKPNAAVDTAPASGKGQQSLRGFFRPKASANSTANSGSSSSGAQAANGNAGSHVESHASPPAPALKDDILASVGPSGVENEEQRAVGDDQRDKEDEDVEDEPFVDPEASKQSWSKLFTKPAAPRCEHGEPCKTMKTKKPGFNCGREFWMCVRPLGPSGAKERNTEWRCSTFIWSSDWSGGTSRDA